MTSVLVCDDSPLAREALRRAVATVPGVERVTTAANGEEVLRRWGADRSDLILMDVRMPGLGGVETVRRLLSADPGARIIMLTVAEDLDGVALAVAAGARGYLHKDASRAELRATVTQALADPTWRLAPRRLRSAEMGAAPTLTAREIQVLEGMSHGRSNAEIGRELFLSEDTVKTHARRLFKKLGASDRAHAVALLDSAGAWSAEGPARTAPRPPFRGRGHGSGPGGPHRTEAPAQASCDASRPMTHP
ncbi:Protein-glutamate methylesterase/protein-glutamine glutaminase [Streptomyces californicus]